MFGKGLLISLSNHSNASVPNTVTDYLLSAIRRSSSVIRTTSDGQRATDDESLLYRPNFANTCRVTLTNRRAKSVEL
jgi:hypothetical protein